jgi:hypothetical protein
MDIRITEKAVEQLNSIDAKDFRIEVEGYG